MTTKQLLNMKPNFSMLLALTALGLIGLVKALPPYPAFIELEFGLKGGRVTIDQRPVSPDVPRLFRKP